VQVSLLDRVVAVLRRGDVLPPAMSATPAPGEEDRRSSDLPGLSPRSPLHELADAVPGLREELVERARTAGLLVGWVAVVAVPVWGLVDRVTLPEQAGLFMLVRLLSDVPMLLAMLALWRLPVGRRRPEALTFFILAVVQTEVAWMISRAEDPQYHLLGFTLAIYGSGCIMVARPRWTAALVGLSWAVLGIFASTAPAEMSTEQLGTLTVYLGTASVIAVLAHLRRYALNNRELVTRVRLEREQQRTGVLLARLERLSHEDPLTGLANRRRWDAELDNACAEARRDGTPLALVLVDLDRFKTVNDRHGHAGGDEALRQVAAVLGARVRGGDLVARLGGDELGVLMPGATLDRAAALAESLRADCARLAPAGFAPGEISLSLGVAAAEDGEVSPAELTARADEQLYRAKSTRNAVSAPSVVPTPRPADDRTTRQG
jgi:diguanylate cyclase (GGDEF)-like protein